jgi:hypothetical protein
VEESASYSISVQAHAVPDVNFTTEAFKNLIIEFFERFLKKNLLNIVCSSPFDSAHDHLGNHAHKRQYDGTNEHVGVILEVLVVHRPRRGVYHPCYRQNSQI